MKKLTPIVLSLLFSLGNAVAEDNDFDVATFEGVPTQSSAAGDEVDLESGAGDEECYCPLDGAGLYNECGECTSEAECKQRACARLPIKTGSEAADCLWGEEVPCKCLIGGSSVELLPGFSPVGDSFCSKDTSFNSCDDSNCELRVQGGSTGNPTKISICEEKNSSGKFVRYVPCLNPPGGRPVGHTSVPVTCR